MFIRYAGDGGRADFARAGLKRKAAVQNAHQFVIFSTGISWQGLLFVKGPGRFIAALIGLRWRRARLSVHSYKERAMAMTTRHLATVLLCAAANTILSLPAAAQVEIIDPTCVKLFGADAGLCASYEALGCEELRTADPALVPEEQVQACKVIESLLRDMHEEPKR